MPSETRADDDDDILDRFVNVLQLLPIDMGLSIAHTRLSSL